MTLATKSLGAEGEARAAAFLAAKGYRMVEKNWRCDFAEVDIIAEHRGVLVFCEVKTRRSSAFGYPEEAITRKKQETLRRAAELYCLSKHYPFRYRIDAVSVILSFGRAPEITHFENITGA